MGGGISLALQEHASEIVAIESNARYANQFEFAKRYRDASKIDYINSSLFTAHSLGTFDIILMLGLFYHFRHPQLFLDYCAGLNCKRFIFSTQTRPSGAFELWNRRQIPTLSQAKMMGWEPTRTAFAMMLEESGFIIDHAVSAPEKRFTNDWYVFCTLKNNRNDAEELAKISRLAGFWF